MTVLYLNTKNGRELIDEKTVEKYGLEAGTLSPFTQNLIVGKNGEYSLDKKQDADSEASIRQDFNEMPYNGIPDGEIDHMENGFEFSQSEIIDFSQGVDSRMNENK